MLKNAYTLGIDDVQNNDEFVDLGSKVDEADTADFHVTNVLDLSKKIFQNQFRN